MPRCLESTSCLLFFFFQAEDGIRDYKVTGVQTCALPILLQAPQIARVVSPLTERCWAALAEVQDPEMPISLVDLGLIYKLEVEDGLVKVELKIGRASCRERV